MNTNRLSVTQVNFSNAKHCEDLCTQLIAYSADIMGGGKPLDKELAENSIKLLGEKSYAFSFLCYDGDQAVGFINCFENVATFAAKLAINIHDLAVSESHRGKGISTLLLNAVEKYAKAKGCYKLTLEVLEGNSVAQASYKKFGFEGYTLDATNGCALFWQKVL